MSGERKLISAILTRGDITTALEKGISESIFFNPDDNKAFAWIFRYYVRFRQVPAKERFKRQFPDYRLVRVSDSDPYVDICEEVLQNVRYKFVVDSIRRIAEMMDDDDASVYDEFIADGLKLAGISTVGDTVRLRDMDKRIDKYEMMVKENRNPMGISFGLPTIDKYTMGMQPGDLVSIAARLGVGKSNLLKHIVKTAFFDHKSVLVFSLEEHPDLFERRLDAMISDLPYEDLKWMKLSEQDMKKWRSSAKKLIEDHENEVAVIKNLRYVNPEIVFSYAERYKPDLIAIDGMHLVRAGNSYSVDWKQITTVLNDLKNVALYTQIPIAGVVQSNRASSKEGVSTDNISFADAIGQLCDVVIGIWQDKEMEKKKIAQIRLAKVRDGQKNIEFLAKWILGPDIIQIKELTMEESQIAMMVDDEDEDED